MKQELQGIAILLFAILLFLFTQEYNSTAAGVVALLVGIVGLTRTFWEGKPKE